MDAVAFSAALNTVEQDHQFVLDRVHALKELVAALMAPGDIDAPQVFGRLQELENCFATQFAAHMGEEEKVLFPLLEQLADEGAGLTDRLRQEHAVLRSKLDDFANCLGVAIDLQDRPPRVVLRDLLISARELWDLLDQHARAETRGIHECLDRHLVAQRL